MKAIRFAVAVGLMTVALGISPASATDCTDPKQSCGSCGINWEMSTEDPRPIVCYY